MPVEGRHLVLLDSGLERCEGCIPTTFGGMGIGELEDVLGEGEVGILGELDITHDGD